MNEPGMFVYQLAFGLGTTRFVLLLRRQLLERFEIIDLALKLAKWIDQSAQARYLLDISLGPLPIIPKVRRAHSRLERG
jgi:hypothetical protein